MGLYKEKKDLGGLYGLCAARCSETYHHWKVFTGTSDGACIEIKRDKFEAALRTFEGVRFGTVDYLKLDEVEQLNKVDVDRLPFVKRIGFTAEEEWRVIAETAEDQKAALSVEFPLSLINCIYLNPWLPKTIADSIKDTVRALPGCKGLKISRSLLIESGRWKRAGDTVVGKKPPKVLLIKRRAAPTDQQSKKPSGKAPTQ